MLVKGILFPVIVFHDRHNLQEINNLIQAENSHIQINGVNHNIDLKVLFELRKNEYSPTMNIA
jgi:hypothetical protein